MKKSSIVKKEIPDLPGVYFFLGKNKEIFYIGKATSLRQRVTSYFDPDLEEKRSTLISLMIERAHSVEWVVTDSVLEALLLETELIKTHRPRYNILSKDDKSYNHIVITKEEYPRVIVVRGKDLSHYYDKGMVKEEFGPFPSGALLREALSVMRRLFQFYDARVTLSRRPTKMERGVIDFNRQIGLYPDKISQVEYLKTIRHVRYFLKGQKRKIIADLTRSMNACARREEFERAEEYKKRIRALTHIRDVALLKREYNHESGMGGVRIEAYDVAHLMGKSMVGVMTVSYGSDLRRQDYRTFSLHKERTPDDTRALREVLERRLSHTEWEYPSVIVVDGGRAQYQTACSVVKEKNLVIEVVSVVKDDTHKPKGFMGPKQLIERYQYEFLALNAEAHRFSLLHHKRKRSKEFLSS